MRTLSCSLEMPPEPKRYHHGCGADGFAADLRPVHRTQTRSSRGAEETVRLAPTATRPQTGRASARPLDARRGSMARSSVALGVSRT